MTPIPGSAAPQDASVLTLARLLRERDQLFLLHEALADAAGAATLEDRMAILVQAIRRVGYGRVETITEYTMPDDASVVAWISNSAFLNSNELIVPVRAVGGATVATLVLGDPAESGAPVLARVRTVELFAQQVASIIENSRLYDESQRERARGEALAEQYRQASEDERCARDAVRQSEARYARLVESASDAIFTIAPDGLLTALNRSLERAVGRSRAQLLGSPIVALIEPSDRGAAERALFETFDGHRRRVELRYPGAHGDLRHCSITLTPLTEGDRVTGALGVVRDVTDERRLAEQLMQQEKLAAVGQLVSGVAHELNNPLASVMAFAQILLAAPSDAPSDRHALEAINQEARRAAKIVSNLLTFARQHQPERRVTDLNRVIEDTLELRRYAMRVAEVDMKTRLDSSLPPTWADPFQIQQVLLNLITNAEQALASWNGPRVIEVSTINRGAQLVIRVTDSGPGVSPEHINRIFNPFFTSKPVGEGTGLGLSISDGIVREHGGRIRVESVPGCGAAFVVELPYIDPPYCELPVPEEDTDETASAPSVPSRRILVVDDEAPIRHAVATYFRSLGHVVDVVGTGRDAVTHAASVNYDALMLDLRLPDISGHEVLAQLRDLDREPGRVVFISGGGESESALYAMEASGHPTVSKPFLLEELAAVVLAEVVV